MMSLERQIIELFVQHSTLLTLQIALQLNCPLDEVRVALGRMKDKQLVAHRDDPKHMTREFEGDQIPWGLVL